MYYYRIAQKISDYSQGQRLDWRNNYEEQKLEGDASWQRQWDNIRDERENKLFDSICAAFKKQRLFGLGIFILYYQLLNIVPVYSFHIMLNIQTQEYSSTRNMFLVGAVILIKLFNPFIRLYGQRVLRMVGQAMHDTVSRAIISKTFNVSLLANPNIAASQLTKIMQIDMQKVIRFPQTQAFVIGTLLALTTNIILIVVLFGWAGVASIVVLIANVYIRYYLKDTLQKYARNVAEATGDRIRRTVDIFNIIKLIKVCALQLPYIQKLVQLRKTELQNFEKRNKFELIILFVAMTAFRFVILAYILTTIWLGNDFGNAATFTLYYILFNVNLYLLLNGIANLSDIKISLRNLQAFLQAEQRQNSHIQHNQMPRNQAITINNGNFYWERLSETQKQSQATRINLSNVQLKVKSGEFVSIIGRYGSGKSSLLHAILGEMKNAGGSKVFLNGKVAYTSQKPFIISDTVKNNIIFGAPFNQKRYNQAVHFSSLKADLQILAQGDQTLIGERGCTLSGGQKARVAFARALYANADILILDDVLSAVDAHVGSFIFFETLCKYCKGKTILMVTHALSFVKHTDRIIMMENCQIVANGTFQQLKKHPIFSQMEMGESKRDSKNEKASQNLSYAKQRYVAQQIKPVVQEQQALDIFFQRSGGIKFKMVTAICSVIILSTLVTILFWMNVWGQAPDKTEPKFALFYLLLSIVNGLGFTTLYFFVFKSPILMNMYKDMIRAIMFSPLSYFENTPVAKIVQRISYDLQNLDKVVLLKYFNFTCTLLSCLQFASLVISISLLTSRFIYTALYIVFLLIVLLIYRKILLAITGYRSLEEQYKVEINTYFGEIVDGQTTIRAYNKVPYKKIEYSQKLAPFNGAKSIYNGAISLLALIPFVFINWVVVGTLLYFFSLESLSKYDGLLLFAVLNEDYIQFANDSVISFYVNLKVVIKCQEMTKLQPQNGYKQTIRQWDQDTIFEKGAQIRTLSPFTRGEIQFRNMSACYRKQFGDILKKVSFKVRPGEKVGVVGRTGSGKSSLFLTLLRIIEPHTGSILIDGIDCSSMSLSTLRASFNFILQEHFLFSGTIRTNVDPVGEHSDEEIIHALRLCGLWQSIRKKQGLETVVAEGGENLSVGERQLLNIARALLSKKKIVLVDQATASIDAETDAAIQKLFRIHFAESTVLTIAHRLDSVKNCDKILVLERGQVKQFDSPQRLLQRDSLYRKLCQQMTRQVNK